MSSFLSFALAAVATETNAIWNEGRKSQMANGILAQMA
jgi:hypothetical protein